MPVEAHAYTDIPDDALAEIFARLDFKDKLRCQAVNKDWRRVLSATKGVWGSLGVNVEYPNMSTEHAPNYSVSNGGSAIRVICRTDPPPSLLSFAAWLARLLRSNCLRDVRLAIQLQAFVTTSQQALLHRIVLELVAADAASPEPGSLLIAFAPLSDYGCIASGAQLIGDIQRIRGDIPTRYSALSMDVSRMSPYDLDDVKRALATLPRSLMLELTAGEQAASFWDVETVQLVGSFSNVLLRAPYPWYALDLRGLPPPRVKDVFFPAFDPQSFFAPFFSSLLRYFSPSVEVLSLTASFPDADDSNFDKLCAMLEDTFSSASFPNLQCLSVRAGSQTATSSGKVEYERSASDSSEFETVAGNVNSAGRIRPDASQAAFLAALPPSVTWVTLQCDGLSLHVAAQQGNAERVADLLARGAHTDILDAQGRTPLMLAVAFLSGSSLPIVRMLLASGADPTIYDGYYMNALQYACLCATMPVVQELLFGPGVNPRARHPKGRSALRIAQLRMSSLKWQQIVAAHVDTDRIVPAAQRQLEMQTTRSILGVLREALSLA